jgi:hypothetical protein
MSQKCVFCAGSGPYEGMRLPVTNMFDIDRNETVDPEMAMTIVAMLPNGAWLSTTVFAGEVRREGLS